MQKCIQLKLYENIDSGKVHLHQVVKRPNGSRFVRKEPLCGRHGGTDDHSVLWKQESITNKQVLMNLLPKLAAEDREHVFCEWCIMKILEE